MTQVAVGRDLWLTHADWVLPSEKWYQQTSQNNQLCKIVKVAGEVFYNNIENRDTTTIPASSNLDILFSAAVDAFRSWSVMSLTADTVGIW